MLLIVLLFAGWSAAGGSVPVVLPDLLTQQAIDPWNNTHCGSQSKYFWTGGDVDASVALSGGGRLFVFGDTLIGDWNVTAGQRLEWPGGYMPHSSIGLWDGKCMNYVYDPKHSYFEPRWRRKDLIFWPLGDLVTGPDGVICVPGDQIVLGGTRTGGPFDFYSNGSWAVCFDDPLDRASFQWLSVPGASRNLSLSNSVALVDDFVYMYGTWTNNGKKSIASQVVCRLKSWTAFVGGRFGALQFYFGNGLWKSWHPMASRGVVHDSGKGRVALSGHDMSIPHVPVALFGPGVSISEFSLGRCDQGCCADRPFYFILSIDVFGTQVVMRTARAPEGPWSAEQAVLPIPAPFNDTSRFFCYAVKLHRQFQPQRPGHLFSFVCNAFREDDLFAPNDEIIYVPQFYRIHFCA